MQIVEFTNLGVASLQHLHVQLACDGEQVVRPNLAGKRVHDFAPGPETVGGIAAALGKARHGTLECMGVEVGHAGNNPATETVRSLRAGCRAPQELPCIHLEVRVLLPTTCEPGIARVKGATGHASVSRN